MPQQGHFPSILALPETPAQGMSVRSQIKLINQSNTDSSFTFDIKTPKLSTAAQCAELLLLWGSAGAALPTAQGHELHQAGH